MPRHSTLSILAVAFLALGGWALAQPVPPAAKNADPAAKPFEGKALWVTTDEPGLAAPYLFLENPQQKRLGDRWFLVGKNLVPPGGVIWWPVERIHSIQEFATREEMAKVVKIPGQPAAARPAPAQRTRGDGFVVGYAALLRNEGVQKELKFSPEQIQKVTEAVQKAYDKSREAMTKLRDLSLQERRGKLQEINRARNEEALQMASGVLSAEQVKRLKQIELQEAMRFGYGQVFGRPDVQKALNLTADQKDQVKSINEDFAKQLRGLFQSGLFQSGRDVTAFRKETNDKFDVILTAEQKKTLKELIGEPFRVRP